MKISPEKSGTFALSFRGESFTFDQGTTEITLSFDDPFSPLLLSVLFKCVRFGVSWDDGLRYTYHPAFVVDDLTVPPVGPMPWQRRIARLYAYAETDEFEYDQTPGYIQFNHHQSNDQLSMQVEWDGKEFQLSATGKAEMDTTFQLSVPAVMKGVEVSIPPDRMAALGVPTFTDGQLAASAAQDQYWLATPHIPHALISEFASHLDPVDFDFKLSQNTNHKWWKMLAMPWTQT